MNLIFIFSMCFILSCKNTTTYDKANQDKSTIELEEWQRVKKVSVLLDVNYKGHLYFYDDSSINYKIVDSICNNFNDEDFVIVDIYDNTESMYYVKASHLISGEYKTGWVKKNSHLGIFVKNYSTDLILYDEPKNSPKQKSIIKNYIPDFITVLNTYKSWLLVKFTFENKEYTGWLPVEMQCTNPYTTCN